MFKNFLGTDPRGLLKTVVFLQISSVISFRLKNENSVRKILKGNQDKISVSVYHNGSGDFLCRTVVYSLQTMDVSMRCVV